MAQIFNGQRVRGVRVLDEGATLFNMMQVRGVRAADEGVMFAGGLQAMGVDVLDADRVIYNDQLVMGVVVIADDRALYNGLEILPAWALSGSLGGNIPAPDVLPAGRMWVGQYDANSVTVTASGVNNVEQMRFAAVPVAGGAAIVSAPIAVDATYDFARTTLTGLAAGTEYDIEIRSVAGNPSGDQGWVKTRPATREAFKIGFASCFRVGNDYTIFDTIIDQNAGMLAFYNLGDRGYADIATNNVALYHAADDNVMAMTRVSRLHRTLPHLYMWDDHDYGPNDSAANSVSRPAAVAWFRNRVPMRPTLTGATDAPYYAHSPMPGVTVAMLDTRSERDFGSGLMISAAQEAWLIAMIQALPDGEALVINSSVPWIASSGSDMWFSASAQRQRIADAVTANCPGQVMIIGGDMHALAWDTGTNSVGGIPVAHAAPLGNAISTKGGPYTVGPITTTESQYGTLAFTPVTGGWTVRFEGWSVDPAGVQTRRIDATVTLSTPVTEAPAFTGTTAISGADTAGSVLTASPGTFTGQPTPTVAYQWRLDGVDVSGQTAATYTRPATVGAVPSVVVTLSNGIGSPAVRTITAAATTSAAPAVGYRQAVLDTTPQFLLMTPGTTTIPDETANGRNATIVGTQGTHVATGPFGLPVFRGTTTSHATVAHDAAFNGTSWTVAFFIHPNDTLVNQQGYFHRGSDQKFSRVNSTTEESRFSALNTEVIATTLLPAAWNFAAMTFDNDTGTGTLYVANDTGDLTQRWTETVASSLHSTTDVVIFNGRQVGTTVDRRGVSAHAGMARWGRALTLAELTTIYNAARTNGA